MSVARDPSHLPGPPYELAGWGPRCGAQLIDGLINLIPAAALFWLLDAVSLTHGHFLIHVTYSHGSGGSFSQHTYGLNPFGLVVWLLILSLYWGVLMARPGSDNGQTIGMRRAGIRVVADSGRELTGAQAILRFAAQAVLWLAFVLPGLLDVLWPLIERENRTWHDLLCRTHVVRTTTPTRTWTP